VAEERRRFPRISISFPVECNLAPKKSYFYTVCKDLSSGGLKIVSDTFLAKGSTIKINLNLVNQMVPAKARVAWCNKERFGDRYTAGLEITEINPRGKQELSTFLNKVL
jgi:c-di-GMP-binding flagellar brake protein YcgR